MKLINPDTPTDKGRRAELQTKREERRRRRNGRNSISVRFPSSCCSTPKQTVPLSLSFPQLNKARTHERARTVFVPILSLSLQSCPSCISSGKVGNIKTEDIHSDIFCTLFLTFASLILRLDLTQKLGQKTLIPDSYPQSTVLPPVQRFAGWGPIFRHAQNTC